MGMVIIMLMKSSMAIFSHANNNINFYFIINEFFALDSRAYREHYSEVQPDIDFGTVFSCNACGENSDVDLPISVNFFWPSR